VRDAELGKRLADRLVRSGRPSSFSYALRSCRPGIEFPVVKLPDFEYRLEELEASENPFVVVVLAHLQTLRTRRQPQNRLEWKLRIARRLLAPGLSPAGRTEPDRSQGGTDRRIV
jgi:hypothetical protein